MICSNCGCRWADFPKEDFTWDTEGIIPKGSTAKEKRKIAFENNKVECCPTCIEELNYYQAVQSKVGPERIFEENHNLYIYQN